LQLLSQLPFLARRLVDADYAALTLGERHGKILDMIVSGMSESQAGSISHPPIGRGVLGNLDAAGAPIRIPQIKGHRRSVGFPQGHPDMEAMIGVGISSDNNDYESIRIYVTRVSGRPPFSPEDQEIIESLAAFAKQALDIDSLRKTETSLRVRAEQAERAKSEFMSMLNHDLKNPIAAMQASVEMTNIDAEYTLENLKEDLQASLATQSAIIDSLLDMARLGKTSQDFEFEDYYPVDLIDGAVRRARKSLLGRHRQIEVDVPTDLPAIRCDPVHLGRVFDNLIGNALKYSDDEITVTAHIDQPNSQVVFRVVDKGKGIPASEQHRIFEPFERVIDSNRKTEGLGLGLAICKTVVEAHFGTIGYDQISARSGGSIFEVTMPIQTMPS
jgi:two-component system sensor histidine kinase KdpD